MGGKCILEISGVRYFSLKKVANENANHLYTPETDSYKKLSRKNYQLFYKWAYQGNINSIKVDNRYYVVINVYNFLVDLVRNQDAAKYLGVSKTTLSRLKRDGILNRVRIKNTKTSFLSFQQISNSRIIGVIESRKKKGHRKESVIPINRLIDYPGR